MKTGWHILRQLGVLLLWVTVAAGLLVVCFYSIMLLGILAARM